MIHQRKRSRLLAPPGSEALIGKLFDGEYFIEEWIGGGAFSNVYKAAERSRNNRIVAVKVIQEAHSNIAKKKSGMQNTHSFAHEVRFNQQLKHGAVARAIRGGQTKEGVDYIVMEYVQGPQLDVYIRRNGPLPFLHTTRIGLDLLGCLKEAHQNGFAHGDLKTGNIIVKSVHPEGPRIKLLDFGHARSFRNKAHLRHHMVGTPAYLAPELVDGGIVDPRAELFALGTILYFAVTGERHIQTSRNTAEECLEYLKTPSKPIPSHPVKYFRPACPDDLAAAIEWTLQRNRSMRPPNTDELIRCLTKAMEECEAESPAKKRGGFVRRVTGAWSDIFERFTEPSS